MFFWYSDKCMNCNVTDSRTERNVKLHSVTHFYRKYLCLVQCGFNDKSFSCKIIVFILLGRMKYTNRSNLTFFNWRSMSLIKQMLEGTFFYTQASEVGFIFPLFACSESKVSSLASLFKNSVCDVRRVIHPHFVKLDTYSSYKKCLG